SGLSGVQSTTSTSSEGFSVVVAEYEYGDDMAARQEELIAAIANLPLPDGAQDTDVQRINLQQFPIYQVSITGGEGADAESLRAIAQAEFLPALTSAEGVSRVEIIGGAENEVQVLLDATAIAESGVSMETIGQ